MPVAPASNPQETPTLPWKAGQARTLTPEQKAQWDKDIEAGYTYGKQFWPQWDRALKRYSKVLYSEECYDINALLDFAHVETKKANLFHRTPEVRCVPPGKVDKQIPWVQILPLRQRFLNHKLGPNGTNAKRQFHKALLAALAASGRLAFKVGYESRTLPIPGQFNPDGSPMIVPIWSHCYITALSSKKTIVPADFYDTAFDEAPWLAVKGEIDATQARRLGWTIPDDFTGSPAEDESRFTHDITSDSTAKSKLEYTEIWLKAHLYDPAVFNPELYRCLILVKGLDEPAYYIDSPDQDLTPEGSLTDDSLVGNPIHIGCLRDMLDSAYPPCDLTVGEQLSMEVNSFRTVLARNRKNRSPITLVSDALAKDKQDQILKDRQAVVPSEFIGDGGMQRVVAVVQAGTEPRDNYAAQDYSERDWQRAMGTPDARTGQVSKKTVTATEIRNIQGSASARDETEKDYAREIFVSLVKKFDTLIQRHSTPQDLIKVLGQEGAALWEQWKLLPGKYAYDILPDAGQYVDARDHEDRVMNQYQLLRKDERVNTDDLLLMVATALNRDPSTFIAPQQDKLMEPPSASMSFKGDDAANPAMGNLLLDFCANAGIKLRPETIQMFKMMHAQQIMTAAITGQPIGADQGQNAHGGSAPQTEPINKHATERTGGTQGVVQ